MLQDSARLIRERDSARAEAAALAEELAALRAERDSLKRDLHALALEHTAFQRSLHREGTETGGERMSRTLTVATRGQLFDQLSAMKADRDSLRALVEEAAKAIQQLRIAIDNHAAATDIPAEMSTAFVRTARVQARLDRAINEESHE